MTGGTCPNCGAPIEFGGAQSIAAICSRCHSAVVRDGADLANLGKVPDLVATGSRLSLDARGSIDGAAFAVIGHLQLGHTGGDAAWDEWYVSFSDGSWGWLAEAQGHLLFTRLAPSPGPLPRFASLHAGKSVALAAGTVAVDEVNDAAFVAAEGELPFRPQPGATYRFADCTNATGAFFTIDYGAAGDEPELFAGRELTYSEAGLEGFESTAARHPEGHALTCPNCGANVGLKITSSESVACPSCRALLDVTKQPARLLAQLHGRTQPPLPLGAKGRIGANDFEVIGWMKRSCRVEGVTYFWDEYLLHGEVGYRWLSESSGHWSFVAAVPAGKITGLLEGANAVCDGRRFRHFQSARAKYEEIQGEFYWRIDAGTAVDTADYVAPPYVLSSETSAGEVNWSRGGYMTGAQIWAAFAQPGKPPPAIGVGSAQPNPYPAPVGKAWGTALIALAVLVAAAIALHLIRPQRTWLRLDAPVANAAQPVTLSQPFELTGGPQAVEIAAHAAVEQAWIGLDVALINDGTGESDAVGFELSHYQGVESGEAWTEGSRSGNAVIGSVPDGRYLLRVEPEIERDKKSSLPSSATVEVSTGVFLTTPLLVAIALVLAWPIGLSFLSSGFEKRRWAESDHSP